MHFLHHRDACPVPHLDGAGAYRLDLRHQLHRANRHHVPGLDHRLFRQRGVREGADMSLDDHDRSDHDVAADVRVPVHEVEVGARKSKGEGTLPEVGEELTEKRNQAIDAGEVVVRCVEVALVLKLVGDHWEGHHPGLGY